VRELEPVGLRARHVGVREDGMDAWDRQRVREIDLDDPRVRVRTTDGVAPQHPRGAEVARVGELPGHLRDRVDAPDAPPDAPELELSRGRAHRPAASLTASKIFA